MFVYTLGFRQHGKLYRTSSRGFVPVGICDRLNVLRQGRRQQGCQYKHNGGVHASEKEADGGGGIAEWSHRNMIQCEIVNKNRLYMLCLPVEVDRIFYGRGQSDQ